MSRQFPILVALASLLLFVACSDGGSSPTDPTKGNLRFEDSGCACISKPYPTIPVFIDGQPAGQLQVFGHLTITLAGGTHTWSTDTNSDPTSVVIRDEHTTTIDVVTNLGGADGCDAGVAKSAVPQ